ncbi:GNAT family N-acetyltransferase [Pedobacter nutrimenti]|jgi:RimJ/RimL family protein N-acetyltransferase|uniref:RimJ/RimL family protein N-acetyltransferase n=1 Tax=Pedobacter nutrimenti TaxID=1241337 RepID=A0A318UN73_9SPHI|nr:GNAT family N-acetyltransferase [Pedobacter nutrimenti]PYF76980.1 RimJ/RimL family protein N-acetyltransferase [Pedobacter nutrimenti]
MSIFIETKRLYFREILEDDDHNMYELDADPEVHKYLGKKPISKIEEAREVITFIRQQYIENGIGRLAIIEKDTNNFVGWGGLKLIKELTNSHINYHDLGYRFMKKYWGKGYATESSLAVIDYAFMRLKLPVIYAIADENNLQSQKVLEKCGFKKRDLFDYQSQPHYWLDLVNPES